MLSAPGDATARVRYTAPPRMALWRSAAPDVSVPVTVRPDCGRAIETCHAFAVSVVTGPLKSDAEGLYVRPPYTSGCADNRVPLRDIGNETSRPPVVDRVAVTAWVPVAGLFSNQTAAQLPLAGAVSSSAIFVRGTPLYVTPVTFPAEPPLNVTTRRRSPATLLKL